jgi:hypothetical protein
MELSSSILHSAAAVGGIVWPQCLDSRSVLDAFQVETRSSGTSNTGFRTCMVLNTLLISVESSHASSVGRPSLKKSYISFCYQLPNST